MACRNPKLTEVIDLAKSIERSTISTKAINNETERTANALHISNSNARSVNRSTFCYRCGSKTHLGNNPNCQAIHKRFLK